MPKRRPFVHIGCCPQCGFRFRRRPEEYQHLSPLGRRLQWAGYLAVFPMMLGVIVFLAASSDERGMIDFAGRDNLLMLAIFQPSIVCFILAMVVPKHRTYRCPQCSWHKTLRGGEIPDPDPGSP